MQTLAQCPNCKAEMSKIVLEGRYGPKLRPDIDIGSYCDMCGELIIHRDKLPKVHAN